MALVKWLPVCLLFVCSCTQQQKQDLYSSLPGYNLSDPVIIHLKSELDEISGITYYAKDSSLFAINDELGMLYKIYLRPKIVIKRWEFSTDGDYEDIVLKDSVFFILHSNGNIDAVTFSDKSEPHSETYQAPFSGDNNFETIYYDEETKLLVLICKNCLSDSKKQLTAYAFNTADYTFLEKPFCNINVDTISALLNEEYAKFKPSAAAFHPVSHELYIVSSVEKAIAIAGTDGTVKQAYSLNPKLFKQPEGICFAPNGDMFISNESAGIGGATILLYKYKPEINERD